MPRKGDKTGVYINCECCNKLVYKTQSQFKKHDHHYCSNECQKKKQAEYQRVDRICPICKKTFNVRRKSSQIYCSKDCLNEHNKTITRPSKKICCQCDYCKIDIWIKPSKYKNYNNHFCSENCSRKWFAEIYSITDEYREKCRERAARILANNVPTTQTKPQIEVNELLKQMGVEFENEKTFTYYSADNYLVDSGLIIEVMGDYWHSNPLKYNMSNINKMQAKVIGRDKSKHSYILKYYNIPILYLWESDIYKNKELCVQLIKKYIENKGVLSVYNSFNYQILDGKLILNENMITTLTGII